MSVEYRLKWRREGRPWSYRIYQTLEAAHRKARGIVALEQVKDETTTMDNMPDLVEAPVLEIRQVGPWERALTQPSPPTKSDLEGMRSYFPSKADDGYAGVF